MRWSRFTTIRDHALLVSYLPVPTPPDLPLVLHRRRNRRAKGLGRLQREVNVSQDLSREVDDVRLAVLDDIVGLLRLRDEPDSANQDTGDVLLDVRSEGHLCLSASRNSCAVTVVYAR